MLSWDHEENYNTKYLKKILRKTYVKKYVSLTLITCTITGIYQNAFKDCLNYKKIFAVAMKNKQTHYSADLNYPDKTNKTWNFKRVFLKLG